MVCHHSLHQSSKRSLQPQENALRMGYLYLGLLWRAGKYIMYYTIFTSGLGGRVTQRLPRPGSTLAAKQNEASHLRRQDHCWSPDLHPRRTHSPRSSLRRHLHPGVRKRRIVYRADRLVSAEKKSTAGCMEKCDPRYCGCSPASDAKKNASTLASIYIGHVGNSKD